MTRTTKVCGILFLLCGIFLLVRSRDRLLADPPVGICPDRDITTAVKDCIADYPCANDSHSKSACLMIDLHFKVVRFPKECTAVSKGRQCDELSNQCKTFTDCEWDDKDKICKLAKDQPALPKTENVLKLIPGDCPK